MLHSGSTRSESTYNTELWIAGVGSQEGVRLHRCTAVGTHSQSKYNTKGYNTPIKENLQNSTELLSSSE